MTNYEKSKLAKCAEELLSGSRRKLKNLSSEKQFSVRNHLIVSLLLENKGRNSEVNGILKVYI